MGVADMTSIPLEVWAAWLERALECNEYSAPEREPHQPSPGGWPGREDAPGSDFNRRGSWEEAGLFGAGWAWERRAGDDRGLIRRPGKDHGVSASVGMVTSKANGWPLLYCWSTSVPEFVAEQCYSRFAVFALLRHAGDYAAAAKELASRGYGSPMPQPSVRVGKAPEGEAGPAPEGEGEARIFRWMSELCHRPDNDKWLWHGFLSRGGVTLLNALWKAGKSTLLAHLVRAFDGRNEEFLGRKIVPSRVLIVSEEHQDIWAERRDELNIGDHVGVITREQLPFRGRSSPVQWVQMVTAIVAAVERHRFDVVVIDTLSKIWPVREENDAGQVEDALMPLWAITNAGAGLLLVHHNRKSGGKDFTGSRGSGGLPAFAETIMEFAPLTEDRKDRKRLLNSGGRYRETPTKWLVELTPSGYVAHGDPDEMTPDQKAAAGVGDRAKAEGWQGAVLAMLPNDEWDAMTKDYIHAKLRERGTPIRNADLVQWLADRAGAGDVVRVGKGSKGDPYRWHLGGGDTVPPLGDAEGTESGTEEV